MEERCLFVNRFVHKQLYPSTLPILFLIVSNQFIQECRDIADMILLFELF